MKPDVYFNVLKYSKMYGPEQAARMAAFEAGNVLAVKELVERERLDCDFHLTRAVDVCLDEEHARATEKAYRELMKIGVADLRDVAFEDGRDAERVSCIYPERCCWDSMLTEPLDFRCEGGQVLFYFHSWACSSCENGTVSFGDFDCKGCQSTDTHPCNRYIFKCRL